MSVTLHFRLAPRTHLVVFKWPALPDFVVWYLPYNASSDTTAQHTAPPHMHVHMHMSACVHVCVVFRFPGRLQ